MMSTDIDLDAEITCDSERDWTPDERRMVILAAHQINEDPRLTDEERLSMMIALITKPIDRRLS